MVDGDMESDRLVEEEELGEGGNLYTGKCCMAGGLKKKKKKKKPFFFFKILFFSLETVHTIDLIASDRRRRSNDADAENNLSFLFYFLTPGSSALFLRTNGADL